MRRDWSPSLYLLEEGGIYLEGLGREMNIILFESNEVTGERVVVTDHRARHIVKILHSLPGDTVRVGVIDGDVGTGKIVTLKSKYPFEVELKLCLDTVPAPCCAIDLLLALPRPIMLKRILSQATALGVGTIHLINADRVEKSFWDAGILREEEYRPHLLQGLEQAVDTRVPHLKIHRHFRPFVEEFLPGIVGQYGAVVIAHPHASKTLPRCLAIPAGRVLYAVGPEGGWRDAEVEKFLAAGMQSFTIGPRILKVDTAVVAIHARIAQLQEGVQEVG